MQKIIILYYWIQSGELFLYQNDENSSLVITGAVAEVFPDGLHGFHIHQFGNLSDSCKGAGPHFNPDGVNVLYHIAQLSSNILSSNILSFNILSSNILSSNILSNCPLIRHPTVLYNIVKLSFIILPNLFTVQFSFNTLRLSNSPIVQLNTNCQEFILNHV